MLADLFDLLFEATLASSLAVLAVLALRRPMRGWFGAGSVYALWIAVPVALVAVMLPAPASETALLGAIRATATPLEAPVAVAAVAAGGAVGKGWLMLGLLLGMVIFGSLLIRQQRRFEQRLGALVLRTDGTWRTTSGGGAPVLLGLVSPRIVLPADFESRYDPRQQSLVLAHERIHLRRGDLVVNALAAALRTLFWFNPLMHLAAARLRHDQELACDSAVLTLFPEARRSYADAMLKTQLAGDGAPVGCHWLSNHPIKERILMLKNPTPGAFARLSGLALAVSLATAGATLAWAAQPGNASPSGEAPSARYGRLTAPIYPVQALQNKISGLVVLRILVDARGKAAEVEVEKATPAGYFEDASLAAVKNWTFDISKRKPGVTEEWVLVPLDFRASNENGEPAKAPEGALDTLTIKAG